MKLKCRSSEVYWSVLQNVSIMPHYFYGEQCILGNLGNNGCHCCYFFPIAKKGFLCFTTYEHYAIQFAFFSLHLINFKGVIGVPFTMTLIFFFVLEHSVTRMFRKQVIYVIITSFATSSTHIYPIEGCYW